jgi:hypothetical protein
MPVAVVAEIHLQLLGFRREARAVAATVAQTLLRQLIQQQALQTQVVAVVVQQEETKHLALAVPVL